MKFLCICQYGNSRSAALVRVFHSLKHEAVAVGVGTSPSAIEVIGDWADHICVMQPHFANYVPDRLKHKVAVFDVGHDQWSNPYNQDLLTILRSMADQFLKEKQ